MSTKKPIPSVLQVSHNLCPVCGKRSYSAAGIHPQCALRQADTPPKAAAPVEKKSAPKPAPATRSWKKTCPKCDAQVHVRKKVCDCGHNFFGR